MKLKGRLKLEIKDASTGEVKEVRVEDNMVTDAVYNVINGAVARARRGNYTQLQLGTATEDIIRMLFGGVMIFGKSIDTSHLTPSADEMLMMNGNGNQQATISGSGLKGTLRSATVTEDSAEFIWDFASTQCNGTIASICLTSNKGGELGCRIEARDTSRYSDSFVYGFADTLGYDKHSDLNASYPRTNVLNLTGGSGSTGLKIIDGNTLVAYRANTKYTWDISKYKNSFAFNDTQTSIPTVAATTETVDTPIPGTTGNVGGNIVRGPMTDYGIKGTCVYELNNGTYNYTLQLTKCTKSSQSTVNVPMNNLITAIKAKYDVYGCPTPVDGQDIAQNINNSMDKVVCTWDNKLIWFVGSYNNSDTDFLNIYIQKFDGSYEVIDQIQEDTIFYNLIDKANISKFCGVLYGSSISPTGSIFDLAVIDDGVYVVVNDYYFYLNMDSESELGLYMSNRPSFYVKGGKNCFSRLIQDTLAAPPFYRALGNAVGASNANAMNWCVNSLLRTSYLATIQNQSNPAIKTPSDIMSITYTLTKSNS
ncbi:MAG: hypothetical protein VZR53_08060 [Prevotella sp.]|nr:hypothetical protein [Prevotella sp.]